MSWENLIKDQGIFSLVIILLVLITLSLDNVWISLGENWCWSPLGLKGLTGFDCIKRKYNDSIQKISSLWFYCLSYCYRYYLNCIMGLLINRGYYMATWRYEISLRVSKNISWVSAANEWNIFSTREEKFCISKWPCNVLFYKHQWTTKPFHFNSFLVWKVRFIM